MRAWVIDDHEAFNTDLLFVPRMPEEFKLPKIPSSK